MTMNSITGRRSGYTFYPTYPDLRQYTNNFSQENFIGNSQFGKVYRGIREGRQSFGEHVGEFIVKIWEKDITLYKVLPGDNERRFVDEDTLYRYFRTHDIFHPNLPEFLGFYLNISHGQLAMLYGMKPLDTLHNLLQKGLKQAHGLVFLLILCSSVFLALFLFLKHKFVLEKVIKQIAFSGSLSWPKRINIAIGIASALEFLHQIKDPLNPPYLLRNLCASHVMIDKDYKPVIYDFGMISGGILTDRRELTNQYVDGCHGYIDPIGARPGAWSEKCDVFSFGVVLLGLITNNVYTEEDFISGKPSVHEWAWDEYRKHQSHSGKQNISLVHANIESEPLFYSRDGIKLTNLAMRCVEYVPLKRPTMKQVVSYLLKLQIVQGHGNSLGIDQIPRGDHATGLANKLSGFSRVMLKRSDLQPMLSWLNEESGVVRSGRSCPSAIYSKILSLYGQHLSPFVFWENKLFKSHTSPKFQAGKKSLTDGHKAIQVFSYEDINDLTEGLSEDNIIGDFEFGEVFRGKSVGKEVTVKIWKDPEFTGVTCEYERKLWDELVLLQHPKFMRHPNMLKLVGYCFEGKQLAIVYDLKPLDTIHNLMVKDNFTWLQRIKVALGFAVLLNFLQCTEPHRIPYIVRNIRAAHIILDQDGFPKLLDFGKLAGGILPERRWDKFHRKFDAGYANYYIHDDGSFDRKCDVEAFGVVLLSLISKRMFVNEEGASEWAKEEYKARLSVPGSSRSQCLLVNQSFMTERGFNSRDGIKITKLAMRCMDFCRLPTMKKVVKRLMKLHAVQNYGDELGVKEMLS
ncbi:hypothetical protein Tsubulata_043751 [Turnera subulata]|uniref:Protein kinase domain-containing protein n=1 Tax=Turnera subulata TaxID=218843 RepID=A0A9Q0F588_9ROSI|nr:hypothetical protein Tsubulata_043751 [Turnera subulata]